MNFPRTTSVSRTSPIPITLRTTATRAYWSCGSGCSLTIVSKPPYSSEGWAVLSKNLIYSDDYSLMPQLFKSFQPEARCLMWLTACRKSVKISQQISTTSRFFTVTSKFLFGKNAFVAWPLRDARQGWQRPPTHGEHRLALTSCGLPCRATRTNQDVLLAITGIIASKHL